MWTRWRARTIPAASAAAMFYLVATAFLSYQPCKNAVPAASEFAHIQGFDTYGYFGDIIDQPTPWGNCTVRIGFTDTTKTPAQQIHIVLERVWTFGGWHVREYTTNEYVPRPIGTLPPATPDTRK